MSKEDNFSKEAFEWLEEGDLQYDIWNRKYRYNNESFSEWLERVSGSDKELEKLIYEKKFSFGGRILANRGVDKLGNKKVTYSNCFEGDTEIITSEGIKEIKDIKVGDKVLSDDGEYHVVNDVMKRDYEGDLYKITAPSLSKSIICTPNHKFLTKNGWKRIDRCFAITRDIHSKALCSDLFKTAHANNPSLEKNGQRIVDLSTVKLSDDYSINIEELDKISIVKKNDLGTIIHTSVRKINRYLNIDDDFAYFIGRWIGDGSITKTKGRTKAGHSILQIVFNATTEKDAFDRCKRIGEEKFGFLSSSRNTGQNVLSLRFENAIIGEWFYQTFGKGCSGKCIPDEYIGNKNILLGICDSDGFISTHGSFKITLKNKNLIEWIRKTMILNNILPSPIKDSTTSSSVQDPDTYELNVITSMANDNLNKYMMKSYYDKKNRLVSYGLSEYVNIKSLEVLENVKTTVYNLSVEETHTYTANGLVVHNCYVITPPSDSLESIFECASKLARTFSYGGGCGIDISKLAPKKAIVNNAAEESSGAVSFMDFYSNVTGLISQSTGRRGATMISISCDHPDLIDFINLKTDLNICTKANISVRVSDNFMNAVINDEDWKLSFTRPETGQTIENTVKAREVFKLLALRNWEMAEPGILYWDRIQNYNLLQGTDFRYAGVNPCAEEPLPAGGSCLLGSINLSAFIDDKFTNKAHLNEDSLIDCVHKSVRALNTVLNEGLKLHPLEEQRNSVSKWRQIGLGTMGLGDMLIMMGLRYGSPESLEFIEKVYKLILVESIKESLDLAKKYGCYEDCNKEMLVKSDIVKNLNLPEDLINDIKKYGLYNSQLLTCAPTGSIGTYLKLSTGVEPHYSLKTYTRRTVSLNDGEKEYEVIPDIILRYQKVTGNDITNLPDYFVDSEGIDPIDRIKVQEMLQRYIDASISSTINLPEKTTVEDIYNIYLEAWKHGLKGITIWRDNCNRQAILTKNDKKDCNCNNQTLTHNAPKRGKILKADVKRFRNNKEKWVACVGLFGDDMQPYEVFTGPLEKLSIPDYVEEGEIIKNKIIVTEKNEDGKEVEKKVSRYDFRYLDKDGNKVTIEAINECFDIVLAGYGRLLSGLLRHGMPIEYIISTIKNISFSSETINSWKAGIIRALSGYIKEKEVIGEVCPECGAKLIRENGCKHCSECGYSACG